MAEDVVYHFIATGDREVVDSFVSITAAARQSAVGVEGVFKGYERTARRASVGVRESGASLAKQQQSDAAKAAKASEQADAARVKSAAKASKQLIQLRERENNELLREGMKLIAAEERQAQRRAASEKKYADKVAKDRAGAIDSVVGSIASMAGGALMSVGRMAAGGIQSSLKESFKVDDIARRISINSRGAGQDFQSPTALRKKFEQTAINTPGIGSDEIADAAQGYIDFTGDVKTAMDSLQTFATVASGTGAKMKDVALAAASFGENFKIKDPKEIEKLLTILAFQGKGAKLTLEQMGKAAQSLAPAAAAFGVESGVGGVAKVGALLQVARGGTNSAAAATTGTRNILTGLKLRSKKFAGVDPYDQKTHEVRDVNRVLAETIGKAGGANVGTKKDEALAKIFGRGAGMMAAAPLIATYQQSATAAGGGKAGQAAGIEAVFEKLTKLGDAADAYAEMQKDASFAQEAVSAKLAGAWERVKAAVAEAIPSIEKSIPGMMKQLDILVPAIGNLAEAAGDAAKALGLFREPTHDDTAKKLEEKAALPGTSPEQAATLRAQAALEHARDKTPEGIALRKAKLRDEFTHNLNKLGGVSGSMIGLGGHVANSIESTGRVGLMGRGMMNANIDAKDEAEAKRLIDKYAVDRLKLDRESSVTSPNREGGANIAGKGGDIIGLMAAQVVASTKAAEAQDKAAKATEAAANKLGAKGGTIAPGAHK